MTASGINSHNVILPGAEMKYVHDIASLIMMRVANTKSLLVPYQQRITQHQMGQSVTMRAGYST